MKEWDSGKFQFWYRRLCAALLWTGSGKSSHPSPPRPDNTFCSWIRDPQRWANMEQNFEQLRVGMLWHYYTLRSLLSFIVFGAHNASELMLPFQQVAEEDIAFPNFPKLNSFPNCSWFKTRELELFYDAVSNDDVRASHLIRRSVDCPLISATPNISSTSMVHKSGRNAERLHKNFDLAIRTFEFSRILFGVALALIGSAGSFLWTPSSPRATFDMCCHRRE